MSKETAEELSTKFFRLAQRHKLIAPKDFLPDTVDAAIEIATEFAAILLMGRPAEERGDDAASVVMLFDGKLSRKLSQKEQQAERKKQNISDGNADILIVGRPL